MLEGPQDLAIDGFEFDDWNVEHLSRHDVTPEIVLMVWSDAPVYLANEPWHTASYVMIGRASGGVWTIAIALIDGDEAIWYPITGWSSTKAERRAWFVRS